MEYFSLLLLFIHGRVQQFVVTVVVADYYSLMFLSMANYNCLTFPCAYDSVQQPDVLLNGIVKQHFFLSIAENNSLILFSLAEF